MYTLYTFFKIISFPFSSVEQVNDSRDYVCSVVFDKIIFSCLPAAFDWSRSYFAITHTC